MQQDFYSQNDCKIINRAFLAGEELHYKVVYNWGLIWLESAEATFNVGKTRKDGKTHYHFKGSGSTQSQYDWFFKVRDEFESTVDSVNLSPVSFRASIREGSKNDKHLYIFDKSHKKAYTIITYGNKKVKVDTLDIQPCSIDVLTAIYVARNLDYSQCQINDTIGVSIVIDGKVHPLFVRYLGKDTYTSEELGTIRCVKFRPLLVEGTIFKKGEHMNVWVSDDKNKLPVYIETSIIVGSIKVSLLNYKGLRHPLDAKL